MKVFRILITIKTSLLLAYFARMRTRPGLVEGLSSLEYLIDEFHWNDCEIILIDQGSNLN